LFSDMLPPINGVGIPAHLAKFKNSSFVNPASEMISMSNPRFISSCFGIGNVITSFTRIM
jgi:hypothetical protein